MGKPFIQGEWLLAKDLNQLIKMLDFTSGENLFFSGTYRLNLVEHCKCKL